MFFDIQRATALAELIAAVQDHADLVAGVSMELDDPDINLAVASAQDAIARSFLRLCGYPLLDEENVETPVSLDVAQEARALSKLYRKSPIPADLRWAVFRRDNFTCKTCGVQAHLQADHVVPERLGGPTTLGNLQTLCGDCNRKKGCRG